MTTLPTLDPEIADLGLAIGLLTSGGGGVQLDSGWFDDPGGRLAGALASDQRRSALVRFAEAVLANGTHTERDGVTLLPLFDLRELAGDDTLPDLTLQVALDARPADYTEVGLAMTLATSAPVTRTDAVIPLYRAAKAGKSVAEPFALLAGATVQLATDLTVSTAQPAPDEFGLAGVAVAVETAVAGTPTPTFRLQLKGLHLPGAAAPTDIQVGGPGVDIEDALLSLVLGVVRQAVDAGGGGSAARDVLDLLGLGDAGAIPALPVDDLLAHGAAALRDWFAELMGAEAARTAWLAALAGLVGGSAADGRVQIPIGAGPVRATVGIRAEAGPGGHLQVTPRLGVSLATDVAGSISLAGEAVADLFTIDVADGSMHPVPVSRSSSPPAATAPTTPPSSCTPGRSTSAGCGSG